jgi:hypothetical protein
MYTLLIIRPEILIIFVLVVYPLLITNHDFIMSPVLEIKSRLITAFGRTKISIFGEKRGVVVIKDVFSCCQSFVNIFIFVCIVVNFHTIVHSPSSLSLMLQ